MKFKVLWCLGILTYSQLALAVPNTCPDFSQENTTWRSQGWHAIGNETPAKNTRFVEALISRNYYFQQLRTVTCNYEDRGGHGFHVAQLLSAKPGNPSQWEPLQRGTINFFSLHK